MSKQEDILFCKIAIQSGLVTQDVAQKCLGLSQRIEASGKPRPRIGTVFIKANVLTAQNVKRIYQAISKRAGSQGAPAPAPRGGRAAVAARAEKPAVRRKPIDPKVLWLGIGSGVACIVFGIIMVLMVISAASEDETAPTSGPASSSLLKTATPNAIIEKLGGAGEKKTQGLPPPPVDAEARERVRGLLRVHIGDARMNRGDGLYDRAIKTLLAFQEENKGYLEKMPEVQAEVDAELKELRSLMTAEVNEKIQEAQALAAQGDKDGAILKLQDIRVRVDPESQTRLDGEIQKIQGGQ